MNVFLFCKITVNKKNLMMNKLRIPTRQSNLTLYQDLIEISHVESTFKWPR